MGLTQSASGLFSTPGIIVSPGDNKGKKRGKRERWGERRREGWKKGIEKERKGGIRSNERSEAR